jgi:hypothetical protein
MSQSTVILNELVVMTKYNPLPPLEELNRRYYIDSSSPSGLRNKISLSGRAQADAVTGALNVDKYWHVGIGGRLYAVHRIVYALAFDCDPGDKDVDHIDRNKLNNRPENLRLLDRSMNSHNSGVRRRNSLGIKGVYYMEGKKSPYKASICYRGKIIRLGSYATLEEAKTARKQAEIDLGVQPGF